MENNERKPGESIKQWRARIKAQKKEQRNQKRIDSVKNREGYSGELEPAVLVQEQTTQPLIQRDATYVKILPDDVSEYDQKYNEMWERNHPEPTISQGYQTVGRKNNNHRVGQKSVFGEREYDAHPSLAQRFRNWITDGLHLTSPPTFQDGYNRTLNAEVPLWESAQGQELKRMGKTAMTDATIVAAPFGLYQFYVNPLAMSAAVGSGVLVDQGTKAVLNEINDHLNESGKQFSENQQNAIRATVGLFSGNKAYRWGDRATKRGLEVAMHTTGIQNPMRQIQDGWRQRNWKQRGDVVNYILTGKNNNGTSNTLAPLWWDGKPRYYTGFWSTTTPEYGRDAVRTYLYGEPLYPFKTPSDQSLGVHANYVAENYPNKKIKVYEADQPLPKDRFRPSEEPISTKSEPAHGDIDIKYGKWNEPKSDFFNSAGHRKETGTLNGEEFIREQDIWKFNSKDFMDKWLADNEGYGILGKLPLKWGLDIVDYHGTPFIVRTPWVSKNIIPRHTIDQGVMYPKIRSGNIWGKSAIKKASTMLTSDHDIEKTYIHETDFSDIDK